MKNILEIKDLKTYFNTAHGLVKAVNGLIKAVDGVTFNVEEGKVSGLVGESGSGKTLIALSILKLVPPPGRIAGGEIIFDGTNLLDLTEDETRPIRGAKISIVFQEPASVLNPVFTIGYQIAEAITAHRKANKKAAKEIALDFLRKVHITNPEKVYHDYPHQVSGGMKQRACIAMALVNSPKLLILDEPTTALDVTIQTQILDLLEEIREVEHISMLFISHDLSVIGRMCDDVAVMFKGKIVEMGNKSEILTNPKEKYTLSLLESVKALL